MIGIHDVVVVPHVLKIGFGTLSAAQVGSLLKTIRPNIPMKTREEEMEYDILNLGMESNRKAMSRNWSNQKANPALKTETRNE